MRLLCINASRPPAAKHFEHWIEEGIVYTLRSFTGSLVGKRGVLLKEIKNPPVYIQELAGRTEPSFAEDRFVEVDEHMNVIRETKVNEKDLVLN